MLDLIGYDPKYNAVATYLLGDVLVVEDLEKALSLWRETRTDKTIVTLEGEVIDPHGVVTGGSRESALAGVLEQKREIRELEAVMERLNADVESALAKHVERKQSAADLTRSRDEAAAALRTDEMALLGQRKDLERLVDERRRLESRRAALAAQALDLARAAEENDARLAKAAAELETTRISQEEAELRAGELRLQTVALADEVDRGVGLLTTLKIAATQATERRQNARQTLDRLVSDQSQDDARSARLEATSQEDLSRAGLLAAQAVELRGEAELAQAEAEALARAHGERQGELESRTGALAAREAELRAARAEVSRLAQLASRLELRAQEAAMRRTGIEEQISDRYRDVQLGLVVVDYHLRPLFSGNEEQRATELRGLIDRMGEINLTAIEESEELQKRYDFLTTQRTDLESAVAQLETAIDKINRASRKRFRETFDAVNAEFQAMFPRLFGGGHAKLALTDENDMLETGIDIVAQPARQEGQPEHRAAVGRRKGAHRRVAAVRHLPGQAVTVLRAGRGGRAAGRGQRGPVQSGRARDDRSFPVHHHHAQPAHDGDRRPALRRHDGGAGRVQAGRRQPAQRFERPRRARTGRDRAGAGASVVLATTCSFRQLTVLRRSPRLRAEIDGHLHHRGMHQLRRLRARVPERGNQRG